MSSSFSSLLAVALAGALISWDAACAEGGSGELSQADAAQEKARQQAVEEQQTRERVAQLARLEAQQRYRDGIEAGSVKDLEALKAARASVWATLLRTNWPTYEALLRQAAQSPRHAVSCTICNGRGSVDFCVVCEGNKKCFRCNGSGKLFGDACPTCRGTGKCYLCFGTGRMPCLFCDDGDVYFEGTPPPQVMPVPGAPLVQAVPRHALATTAQSLPHQAESTTLERVEASAEASPEVPLPPANSKYGLLLALLLCGILAIRVLPTRIAEFFNRRFDPWAPRAKTAADSAAQYQEDKAYADFIARFRTGAAECSCRPHTISSSDSATSLPEAPPASPAADPQQDFPAAAGQQLKVLRCLLQDIQSAPKDALPSNLSQFVAGLEQLKELARQHEVVPAWQMTYALECLARQLSEKIERVTTSTLRTLLAGMDLTEKLCRPGLRADLCTDPPIRLLAVDDNLISLRAVAFALKKGVARPDLAEKAAEALALAERQAYDVIFLDVEMPGMDGYQLCAKIRETPANATTPVVFVTLHSSFDDRAKSTMAGGNDLIAKPFMIFELTVKALTLVLARRLEQPQLKPATATPGAVDPTAPAIPVVAAEPAEAAPVSS